MSLADKPLILHSGTLTNVALLVKSAYAGGTWAGPGIGSSVASLAGCTDVSYATAQSVDTTS